MNGEEFKKWMSEMDNKIQETHKTWCKSKDDHQILETLLNRRETDESYYEVNKNEMFNRQKN